MPLHDFRCTQGHVTEYLVDPGTNEIECMCGDTAKKVFLSAPLGFVQGDVCYDSPIDGRPITSMKARIEDLARSNCVPYDPDIKQDYQRRIDEGNKKLEKSFDTMIEKEIEALPPRKRESLANELKHSDVDYHRGTAPAKPIATEIVR